MSGDGVLGKSPAELTEAAGIGGGLGVMVGFIAGVGWYGLTRPRVVNGAV